MLRVHFTHEDLARTRVASTCDPLWELVLSLHQLRDRDLDADLTPWRMSTLKALQPAHQPVMGRLLRLVPPRGYFPDFLIPPSGITGFDGAIEDILGASKRRLRADMTKLSAQGGLPVWAAGSAASEHATILRKAGLVRSQRYSNSVLHALTRLGEDLLRG